VQQQQELQEQSHGKPLVSRHGHDFSENAPSWSTAAETRTARHGKAKTKPFHSFESQRPARASHWIATKRWFSVWRPYSTVVCIFFWAQTRVVFEKSRCLPGTTGREMRVVFVESLSEGRLFCLDRTEADSGGRRTTRNNNTSDPTNGVAERCAVPCLVERFPCYRGSFQKSTLTG